MPVGLPGRVFVAFQLSCVLPLQVVAEQQEKTTLEETLTSEISNLQEQLGKIQCQLRKSRIAFTVHLY